MQAASCCSQTTHVCTCASVLSFHHTITVTLLHARLHMSKLTPPSSLSFSLLLLRLLFHSFTPPSFHSSLKKKKKKKRNLLCAPCLPTGVGPPRWAQTQVESSGGGNDALLPGFLTPKLAPASPQALHKHPPTNTHARTRTHAPRQQK